MEKWDFIAKTMKTNRVYCPGETGKDAKRALIKMGFVILSEDDNYYTVQPPNGWTMEAIPSIPWYSVKNQKGEIKFNQKCYRKGGGILILESSPTMALRRGLMLSLFILMIVISTIYCNTTILPGTPGVAISESSRIIPGLYTVEAVFAFNEKSEKVLTLYSSIKPKDPIKLTNILIGRWFAFVILEPNNYRLKEN